MTYAPQEPWANQPDGAFPPPTQYSPYGAPPPPGWQPPGPGAYPPPGPGAYAPGPGAYVPPAPPGATLGMHVKRTIEWNVSDVVVSPREQARLHAAGVSEPRLQALLAWRRSALLVVLPILLLSLVLALVDAATAGTDGLTDFGKLWVWLSPIGLAFVPIGVVRVLMNWTELRRPGRTLVVCWALSIAIPVFAALMPFEAIIDVGTARAQATTAEELKEIDAVIFGSRIALAVGYALTLLPVIVTVPSGVLKGAGRVKSLFPAAVLPGWFLVTVAPFYSLFMVVVFVSIEQIVGNALLLLGIALLAFAPWVIVINRRTYARAMSIQEARTELARAGRIGGFVTLGGLGLVLIYLLTAKVQSLDVVGAHQSSSVFTYLQVGRAGVELLARSIVTAVVFSMIFLSMIYAEWRAALRLRPDVRAEHDMEMNALRRYAEP